jgi:hypothetical protein
MGEARLGGRPLLRAPTLVEATDFLPNRELPEATVIGSLEGFPVAEDVRCPVAPSGPVPR